jgi:hypothetical protein
MKNRVLILRIIVATLLLCYHFGLAHEGQARGDIVKEVFRKNTREEAVHNAFFRIKSPDGLFCEDQVFGTFGNGDSVMVRTPFYTASIGKAITAVAIKRLKKYLPN